MVFEPQFLQILPRIDISTPIGIGYNFLGLSEVDPAMNRGTGDMTVGVNRDRRSGLEGHAQPHPLFGQTKFAPAPFGDGSSGRALSDWDFIGVSVERSF